MAVATDAVVDNGGFAAATTRTWSHTSTGATNLLYVVCAFWNTGGTVSTVTFGAQSLVNVVRSALTASNDRVEVWRLIAPTAGTATITVTFSAAADGDAYSISFTGGDQTTPERSTNSTTGHINASTAGTLSLSLASAAAGDEAVDGFALSDRSIAVAMTAHSGRTSRSNNTGVSGEGGGGSSMDAPATPQTMDWTCTTSLAAQDWAMAGVVVAAAGGAVAQIPYNPWLQRAPLLAM